MVKISSHKPYIFLMVMIRMHWLTYQTSAIYTQVTVKACGPLVNFLTTSTLSKIILNVSESRPLFIFFFKLVFNFHWNISVRSQKMYIPVSWTPPPNEILRFYFKVITGKQYTASALHCKLQVVIHIHFYSVNVEEYCTLHGWCILLMMAIYFFCDACYLHIKWNTKESIWLFR